jgi:hypothetical protein
MLLLLFLFLDYITIFSKAYNLSPCTSNQNLLCMLNMMGDKQKGDQSAQSEGAHTISQTR